MESVPTSTTPLVWDLLIRTHNTITDRTLSLTLERTFNIPAPRTQRINQGTVKNSDCTQGCAQPGLPLLLIDGDAVQTFDMRVGKGEGGREGYAH
jgi:hypothetical protein